MFSMFQIRFWYDNEHGDQNDVKIIAIRCSNCGKETGLSMKNMNTNYKYIITSFVFNKVLHHFGRSCMIETHEQLKYDMDKHNPDWITENPDITHIFVKKYMGQGLNNIL